MVLTSIVVNIFVDFVYVQTEYPDDAYFIGRVVEFVYVPRIRQPKPITSSIWQRNGNADDHNGIKREDTPVSSVSSTTQAASMQLRARLAWYHRSKELPVSRAKSKESRLLIATIHADLNPISAIKSKVVVRHTREIHDLNAWKNAPDHFYYNQLFDRYSTRLYDIVPVDEIRNAPQNVLQKLTDTYEFIFAEPQKIADLVSTRRACNICAKWCSVNESLKCSVCDKTYHMQCLDPPLTRKPAKGYSWHCAACLKQSQEQRHESNGSVTPSAIVDSSERKRSTRATQVDENVIALRSGAGGSSGAAASDTESRSGSKRLKTAHGGGSNVGEPTSTPIPRPKNRGLWPFRYFGVYTEIDDVLHDDERIYPRSVSRIGPKYQAIVPDMVSPAGRELDIQLTAKFRKLNSKNQRTGSGIESRDELSKKLSQLTAGNSLNTNTTGGGGGGGGGVGRWHGKSAEQMDLMWDQIEVVRGNGDAQLFFRQPDHLDNDELDMYMGSILPYLQRHFAHIQDFTLMDCQDAALHGLAQHSYDVEEALITIPDCPEAYVRPRDVTDGWNASGVAQFNEYLREYGANLQSVHEAMPMMSRRAVVLRFYLIAKSKLGLHLLEDFSNRNRAAQRRFNLGQGEGAGTNLHIEVASDAGISGVNTPSSSPHITALGERSARRCIHCQQESSARWYPAPADVVMYNTRGSRAIGAQRIICADCREYWQHYAMMPDQETINARNQQSQSANGTKGGSGSGFRGQSR
ncbi:putative PHD type zinc finger protein with BAH domain-containing protein, partial [Coemansia sp. RSA 2607]